MLAGPKVWKAPFRAGRVDLRCRLSPGGAAVTTGSVSAHFSWKTPKHVGLSDFRACSICT